MTTRERISSLLGFTAPDNSIEGAMADVGLTGSETYGTSNQVAAKTAAIQVMEILLTTADTGGSEALSIKYDRGAVEKRLGLLKKEIGVTDELQPTIRRISVW